MSAPSPAAARRWMLTIGVAVITVSGAYLGANLKADQELRRDRKNVLEASLQDQLAILDMQRQKLVAQKHELEKKLTEVRARRAGGDDG